MTQLRGKRKPRPANIGKRKANGIEFHAKSNMNKRLGFI